MVEIDAPGILAIGVLSFKAVELNAKGQMSLDSIGPVAMLHSIPSGEDDHHGHTGTEVCVFLRTRNRNAKEVNFTYFFGKISCQLALSHAPMYVSFLDVNSLFTELQLLLELSGPPGH